MNARSFLRHILMVFFASILPLAAADEKPRIEGLIAHIEGLKDANFIRNGKSYDSKNAARFLRGKWEAKAKEIKTAEEFINKVATVSGTTGKPYLIRFKDGREVPCGIYLKGLLKE